MQSEGFVVMSAAKPIAMSFDETAVRKAALEIIGPKHIHRWGANGKLFLRRGQYWFWTGIEVLPVRLVGPPNVCEAR